MITENSNTLLNKQIKSIQCTNIYMIRNIHESVNDDRLGKDLLPGLSGFSMTVNGIPDFAYPRACRVNYLDTSIEMEYRDE